MEYDAFVKNFDCFTICRLPTQYDKSAAGYIFPSQKVQQGKYTDDPVSAINKFDIVVEKAKGTSHVWIQFLTDTVSVDEAAQIAYSVELTNSNKQIIHPALPFNYKESYVGKPLECQRATNGQMYNLGAGSYRLKVKTFNFGPGSTGRPSGIPGRQWTVRVVSPDVTKFGTVALTPTELYGNHGAWNCGVWRLFGNKKLAKRRPDRSYELIEIKTALAQNPPFPAYVWNNTFGQGWEKAHL